MFNPTTKHLIAERVQQILKDTMHPELPDNEIQFLLHVDGEEAWSWANIRNNNPLPMVTPITQNLTVPTPKKV